MNAGSLATAMLCTRCGDEPFQLELFACRHRFCTRCIIIMYDPVSNKTNCIVCMDSQHLTGLRAPCIAGAECRGNIGSTTRESGGSGSQENMGTGVPRNMAEDTSIVGWTPRIPTSARDSLPSGTPLPITARDTFTSATPLPMSITDTVIRGTPLAISATGTGAIGTPSEISDRDTVTSRTPDHGLLATDGSPYRPLPEQVTQSGASFTPGAVIPTGREITNTPVTPIDYISTHNPIHCIHAHVFTDGRLFNPVAIAVDSSTGNMFISDMVANGKIHVLDKHRRYVHSIPCTIDGHSFRPAGLAVTDNGLVAVSDTDNKRVVILNQQGLVVTLISDADGQFVHPVGVAYWRGCLYIADYKRVQVLDTDGGFVRSFSHVDIQMLWGIFVDDRGIIVSDKWGHCIHSFSLDGRLQWKMGKKGASSSELKYPRGVSRDPHGFVLVADNGNQRVQVLAPDGNPHAAIHVNGRLTNVIVLQDGTFAACLPNYGLAIY